MVLERRYGPRQLRRADDDDDETMTMMNISENC